MTAREQFISLVRHMRTGNWVADSAWSLTDQAIFSSSHFLLNVLLARWLDEKQFGAFVTVYTIFLLVATLHTAFLTEPMLLFGSGRFQRAFRHYYITLLRWHVPFASALGGPSIVVGIVSITLGYRIIGVSLLAAGLVTPLLLLYWLTRRSCYAVNAPKLAACAGVTYPLTLFAGLIILELSGHLSPVTAIVAMGLASVAPSSLIISCVIRSRHDTEMQPSREVASTHWRYGRWAAGSHALQWLPQDSWPTQLALWSGLEASGAWRALLNLFMPILQFFNALSNVMLPGFARERRQGTIDQAARGFAVLFVATALGYWLIMVFWGQHLLSLLYTNKYNSYFALLPWLGLVPIVGGLWRLMGNVLRALDRIEDVFRADIRGAFAALIVGIATTLKWGIPGAIGAAFLSLLVSTAFMLHSYLYVHSGSEK